MIDINPDVELPKEKPGQEFGYNFLEDLPPVEVGEIIVEGVEIKPDPDTFLKDVNLKLPLQPKAIRTLQAQDTKIINLLNRLMFSRDPYMHLNQLISQARRYLGNDEGIP